MENTSVYQKIYAVMSELSSLEKDGTVSIGGRGGYQYVTEENFVSSIRPLLVKHKLLILPISMKTDNNSVTHEAKTTYCATTHAVYRIIDVESGASVDVEMTGSGLDNGDKNIPKSITAVRKYLLRHVFFVATGGDDAEATDEDGNDTSAKPPIALAASRYKEITGQPFTKDMLSQLGKANYATTNGFGPEENKTAKFIVKLANDVKNGKTFEEALK